MLPAIIVALDLGIAFLAPDISLLLESPEVDRLLDEVRRGTRDGSPLLVRLASLRGAVGDRDDSTDFSPAEISAALLAWAAPYADLESFAEAIADRRHRLAELRRDDALLTFATAHATKGLEFDHVAVIGLEAGRFPNARALTDAADPARALEEERRLAYVAWTRARRSLTLLYDPAAASPFLLEAFSPEELGVRP